MTDTERLAAIGARLNAATRGPWVSERSGMHIKMGTGGGAAEWSQTRGIPTEDAEFIVHAPEDIRFLLGVARGVTFGNPEQAALRAAAQAAFDMVGQAAARPGVDRQAYDALMKSLQDTFGSPHAQVERAVSRARAALREGAP